MKLSAYYETAKLAVPIGFRHAVRARLRAGLWRRAGVIFVHVPKAAGTSLSMALYGRLAGHLRAYEIRAACPGEFRSLPSFAVVRNPWERTLSAYKYMVARAADGLFTGIPGAELDRYFGDFATFATAWLPRIDVDSANYVFNTQASYVTDNHRPDKVIVDRIWRLGEMDEVERYLLDQGFIEGAIPRLNVTEANKDLALAYADPRVVEAVARAYARDIDLFGFRFGT